MHQKAAAVEGHRNGPLSKDMMHNQNVVCEVTVLDLLQNDGENLPLEEIVQNLQAEIISLKKKRADEGKANERVVSIFASREQAWKAERRRFMKEQKQLWLELQNAFMEQEALRQKIQDLEGAQGGDFEYACEECEQREAWLAEMKERLHEQEVVIMATAEKVEAEQLEKNALADKLAMLEGNLCQVNEKLRLEVEAHTQDVERHESALSDLDASQKKEQTEKEQALQESEHLQSHLNDITQEREHCEGLVIKMSLEIHTLQATIQEKEGIILAMLRKADAEVEERQELERELARFRMKVFLQKWKNRNGRSTWATNSPCIGTELVKSRRSFGSKTDSGIDKMRELQRLHDAEVQDLRLAFEGEVKLFEKKLSIIQQRVMDLEENVCLREAKSNLPEHQTVYDSIKKGNVATLQFQLSALKTVLRQYMDTGGQKEQEIERWMKAYSASKAAIRMLQEERGYLVPSPKGRGLGDLLDLERARSRLEKGHLQEIKAFKRQLKARDERMEAFRQQLLATESEAKRKEGQMELLRTDLQIALEESRT